MADDIICRCKDCVYYHSANGLEKTSGNMMCHFALENGYPRLIPPVDCYKKKGTGYISRKDKNKRNPSVPLPNLLCRFEGSNLQTDSGD